MPDEQRHHDLPSTPQLNAPLRQNLELKNLFDEEYEAGTFLNYAYPGAPPLLQAGITYTF